MMLPFIYEPDKKEKSKITKKLEEDVELAADNEEKKQ